MIPGGATDEFRIRTVPSPEPVAGPGIRDAAPAIHDGAASPAVGGRRYLHRRILRLRVRGTIRGDGRRALPDQPRDALAGAFPGRARVCAAHYPIIKTPIIKTKVRLRLRRGKVPPFRSATLQVAVSSMT